MQSQNPAKYPLWQYNDYKVMLCSSENTISMRRTYALAYNFIKAKLGPGIVLANDCMPSKPTVQPCWDAVKMYFLLK